MFRLDETYSYDKLHRFAKDIALRLKDPLPGNKAHLKMASNVRMEELKFNMDSSNAKLSSVLILLYLRDGKLHTLFIQRQTYDGVHSGQVSFPGGRIEDLDNSLIETALREAQEEVNIQPSEVKILGTLSELYIPPSNFLVLPVLGYTTNVQELIPEPNEVAQIIESELSFLVEPAKQNETVIQVRGHKIRAPYFDVNGHIVWGATAMILCELKEVIESIE